MSGTGGAPIHTPELASACAAARAGGLVVADRFRRGIAVREKGRADLVTEADTTSEETIVAALSAAHPDHAILAEESRHDDAGAEHLWIVDPLDGTTNFAHGLAHFAVSIAYYRDGRAECGVVHDPIADHWYVAARGRGAFLDGARLAVAPDRGLETVLVGTGFYYDRGAMMEATLAAIRGLFDRGIHGIRRFGTASLDLCYVARGIFGGFFEFELAPWDFAAARLVVEEAGGTVTTCTGAPLTVGRSTVAASNGHLHAALLDAVGPHVPAARR